MKISAEKLRKIIREEINNLKEELSREERKAMDQIPYSRKPRSWDYPDTLEMDDVTDQVRYIIINKLPKVEVDDPRIIGFDENEPPTSIFIEPEQLRRTPFVLIDGREAYLIDPAGYDYARYVMKLGRNWRLN